MFCLYCHSLLGALKPFGGVRARGTVRTVLYVGGGGLGECSAHINGILVERMVWVECGITDSPRWSSSPKSTRLILRPASRRPSTAVVRIARGPKPFPRRRPASRHVEPTPHGLQGPPLPRRVSGALCAGCARLVWKTAAAEGWRWPPGAKPRRAFWPVSGRWPLLEHLQTRRTRSPPQEAALNGHRSAHGCQDPEGGPVAGLLDFRAHFHLLLDSPGTIGRASLRTDTWLPDLPVLRVPISVSGAAVPPGPKSRSRLRTTLRHPHLVRWQLLLPINVKKRPQSCPLPFYGSHLGAGHSRPSQSGGTASCGHPAATLRGRSGLLKTALSSRGTPSRSPCARLLA